MKGRKKRKKPFGFWIFITAGVLYLGLGVYFMDHFFPGTLVNGEDYSFQSVSQAEILLLTQAKEAPVTLLERGQGKEQLTMGELGGHYEVRHEVLRAKRGQNGFVWPRMFFQKDAFTILPEAVFEERAFLEGISRLACIQDEIEPKDARICFTDTGYEIEDETEGNTLDRETFYQAVREAFTRMEENLDLEAAGCYQEPKIRRDSAAFQETVALLDTWMSAEVTYEIGPEPLTLDMGTLQEWITLSGETARLETEKIGAYIDALADTYDSQTEKRVFYSTRQGRIVLSDKKHKWYIDREAETAALIDCIQTGGVIQREPIYQVPAGSHMGSEIGDTYVEVDMGAQHLWVYRDGQMVLETDVVTGNTGRHYGTPGMLAYIYNKERNRTLRGANYASFVKYWVPFYKGYGIHDASWRGAFGGTIYKTNGSHGCVNIPPSVMPKLYENVEVGMPVVTYY